MVKNGFVSFGHCYISDCCFTEGENKPLFITRMQIVTVYNPTKMYGSVCLLRCQNKVQLPGIPTVGVHTVKCIPVGLSNVKNYKQVTCCFLNGNAFCVQMLIHLKQSLKNVPAKVSHSRRMPLMQKLCAKSNRCTQRIIHSLVGQKTVNTT